MHRATVMEVQFTDIVLLVHKGIIFGFRMRIFH